MKVKIRGLVFVGFAAAVFAQSAMADTTTDAKTVTSKLYVDNYAQEQAKRVKIGNGGGTNEYASVDALTDTQWNDNSLYPSMPVLKAVKDAVAAVDVVDDGAGYVDVSVPATGVNAGKYVVGLDKDPVTSNAGITGTFGDGDGNKLVTAMGVKSLIDTTAISSSSNATHLPTSQAVYNYAEAKANKLAYDATNSTETISAEATATTNNTSNVTFPTTKNVYEFVTSKVGEAAYQRKLTTTETGLYVGQYDANASGTDKSTWKSLEPVAAANSQVTATDYVTIMDNGSGVYQVNIPAAQIATTAALTGATATNDTGLVTAGSVRQTILQAGNTAGGTIATNNDSDTKVPTTKNVYEFVTTYAQDTYQPKVGVEGSYDPTANNNAGASKIMIGYTTRSGTAPYYTYSSEWKPLTGTSYVNVGVNVESNLPEVSLNPSMITSSGASITAATGGTGSSSYNDLLPTAQAVNEFVTGLTGGLTIPEPTGDCANTNMTSTNDTACALVLAYWTAAESPTGQAGVGLKWVPMAQTVSSGSSNQQSEP